LGPEKAKASISLTDAGIQIDVNDEQPENAPDPILPSFDDTSKVTL
jgi:hypothetical protein